MVTFVVSGLWHGANWTFLCWGVIHGLFLVAENILGPPARSITRALRIDTGSIFFRGIAVIWTFFLVCAAWVLFRANSLHDVGILINSLASDPAQYLDIDAIGLSFRGMGLKPADLVQSFVFIGILLVYDIIDTRHDFWKLVNAKPLLFRLAVYYTIIILIMFNQYAYADRVKSVEEILNNSLSYIFDRSVAKTSWLVTKAQLQKAPAVSSIPPMTREMVWDWNIKVKANDHNGKFSYPEALYKEMKRVVRHAKENGTEIVLIIVPHHVEMQARVVDYGLTDEMNRFRKDLFELGVKVYDYDFVNEITIGRNNFVDPLHFTIATGDRIINEVWREDLKVGRLLTSAIIDSLVLPNKLTGQENK